MDITGLEEQPRRESNVYAFMFFVFFTIFGIFFAASLLVSYLFLVQQCSPKLCLLRLES